MSRRKKKVIETVERKIRLEGIGKEFELSKVTMIKFEQVEKEMIYFDKLKDGTWRLVYSEKTIPDIQKLIGLTMVRKLNI